MPVKRPREGPFSQVDQKPLLVVDLHKVLWAALGAVALDAVLMRNHKASQVDTRRTLGE